jgi:NAD(P)-dependent dehydrogenase (short-subunit alcohol dehydrogenase family)
MSRIATPFGFATTAAEAIAGIDLAGKRAIVTGGASGIGVETARALAGAGAEVTLAVRDSAAGETTAKEIAESTGNSAVAVRRLDLAERASVNEFAAAWSGPLHILVNNAGVMAVQELTLNADGHELQFATNHLGHFELALALHDALAAGASDGAGARIVSLSSSGHLRSPVIFDDIDFRFRPYEPFLAYGQSKTANVLFAVEATRRWAGDGITANAAMPGGIMTNLQRHVGGSDYMERAKAAAGKELPLKTPEQGASTSIVLATSPLLEGIGGRYFDDCNEAEVLQRREGQFVMSGVAPFALDPANAERLWDASLEMLG